MGRRGRKREPTASLKLRIGKMYKSQLGRDGTGEPAPPVAIPDPPIELEGLAKATWERLAPQLAEIGCLTEVDAESLAIACNLAAGAMSGDFKCIDRWRHYAAMFGLSPADRASIVVTQKKGQLTGPRDRSKDRRYAG